MRGRNIIPYSVSKALLSYVSLAEKSSSSIIDSVNNDIITTVEGVKSVEFLCVSRHPNDDKFYVDLSNVMPSKQADSDFSSSSMLQSGEEVVFTCRKLFPSHEDFCTIALMSMVGIHRVRGGKFVTKGDNGFSTGAASRVRKAFIKHSIGCYHCKQQSHLTYQCEKFDRLEGKDNIIWSYLRQACMPLNTEQIRAVTSSSPTTMVLAGAGTGKTKVIVHRIAWLLNMGYSPDSIFATTFTNKVAAELKERIRQLCPSAPESVGTFHGLALKILASAAGLSPKYQIIDSDFQKQIIKSILKRNGEALNEIGIIVSFINRCKDDCLRSSHLKDSRSYLPQYVAVYREYEEICLRNDYLDFGEILLRTLELLSNNREVLSNCQKLYSHFLVDEFQDTNIVQYKILTLLYGNVSNKEKAAIVVKRKKNSGDVAARTNKRLKSQHRSLFVVGDDDQAIYGFRGACSEIMQSFLHTDFPGSAIVKLEENYRSTRAILAVANAVIKNNQNRIGKTLWTDKVNHLYNHVLMMKSRDDIEEANLIADIILSKTENSEFRFQDILIMYRTKMQSRALEKACIQYNIPYRIKGGTLFLDREEIKHLIAYIRLLINRRDDVSFVRIVNTPARGISDATVDKLKRYAARHDLSLWSAAEAIVSRDDSMTDDSSSGGEDNHEISTKALQSIRSFVILMLRISGKIFRLQPKEALEHVLEESGLLRYYENHATKVEEEEAGDNNGDSQKRLDNLKELLLLADQYNTEDASLSQSLSLVADTAENSTRPPIIAFLNDLTMSHNDNVVEGGEGDDIVKENTKTAGDCVQLMTIHAAKGLEFPLVFVVGLSQGILPLLYAEEDEERRLFYVALTRAKEQLILSHYKSRWRQPLIPSKFIRELPASHIKAY